MNRPALLAGLWYPSDPRSCRAAVERHGEGAPALAGAFRGLVGPHAGFTYSGDCAGRTYRVLERGHADAELVVVFGSHRGPHGPHTIFLAEGWETPLGTLTTDPLAERVRAELALDAEPVRPARPDNAVELHLPFVRASFPRARLLMLGVGASEVALHIGRVVGELVREAGRDAVFVGSTDLTHYGPSYDFTPVGVGPASVEWVRDENDRGFLDAVVRDDPRGALQHALAHGSACCPGAVAAVMEAVRAYEGVLHPTLVHHALSYDVRPDASFVGYGGVVL
jgi:AmmeMemoRadiSam system protein B